MAEDTFYDAISEEPIKMLDEFIETAFEAMSSHFKGSSSTGSSSGGRGTRQESNGTGGSQQSSGGGCTCCSWFCRCR